MKYNGVKKLQIIALGLQFFALVLTVFLTVFKSITIKIYGTPHLFENVNVIPIDSFVRISVILLIYLFGFLVMSLTKINMTKFKSGIFIVFIGLAEILLSYTGILVTRLVSTYGVDYITAYSSISSVVGIVVTPFTLVALLLFCVSCGGYYGMENKV